MAQMHVIKYYDNIFSENKTSYKMTRSEAVKQVSKMKKENAISKNNHKVLYGKPFEQYKRIKIVKA